MAVTGHGVTRHHQNLDGNHASLISNSVLAVGVKKVSGSNMGEFGSVVGVLRWRERRHMYFFNHCIMRFLLWSSNPLNMCTVSYWKFTLGFEVCDKSLFLWKLGFIVSSLGSISVMSWSAKTDQITQTTPNRAHGCVMLDHDRIVITKFREIL